MLLGFFGSLEGKVQGMKGFLIMDNLKDEQETLVLTFWEIRQDMEAFYQPDNKALAEFIKNTQQLLEQPPQRTDYEVVKFII